MKKNLTRLMSLTLSLLLILTAVPAAHAAGASYANVAEGAYTIASKADEKFVLDIYGDTTISKANAQVYENIGNATQTFNLSLTDGGWYSIVPQSNTSLAVNPFSDAPKANTNINVYKADQKDHTQGFYFEEVDGYYAIRSAYNDALAVTVEGSVLKNFTNVRLETYTGKNTQLWKLTAISANTVSAGYGDEDVRAAVQAIGVQTDKKSWSMMCASLCVSYARHLQTGIAYTPEQSSDRNGLALWSYCGGASYTSTSQKDLLAKMKAQLDAGGLAILHVASSYGQHWILVYRYEGDGSKTSDFCVADPWQGNLKKLNECGYALNSSGKVVLC